MPKNRVPTQAVILAAGQSSRFTPFNTRSSHKSCFEVMGKPIITRTIEALAAVGVREIIVVHTPDDSFFTTATFGTSVPGVQLSTHVQEHAEGMGAALLSVREQLHERFILLNPQQVNCDQHLKLVDDSQESGVETGVILFSQATEQPEKYGMLQLEAGRVTGVIEKPQPGERVSNQRLLGMYILTRKFIEHLETKPVSQYNFEEALSEFCTENTVLAIESQQPALTLKYAWDLLGISEYLLTTQNEPDKHSSAEVHPTAVITGAVKIAAGAKIHEFAVLHGPCYIGRNVVVGSFCKVRPGSVLEEGVVLQNGVEVKHSLIGRDTHIHSGFVGDSILGENIRIGAHFVTANRRLDRKVIEVQIKGAPVSTQTTAFGAVIGDATKIGIHCGTNPGVIVPAGSTVYPGTIVTTSKNQ